MKKFADIWKEVFITNNAPYEYSYINSEISQDSPSTVHPTNTALAAFFRKYLLERAMSIFEWEIPENWPLDYFLYTLYCKGFAAVVKTDKFGIIVQHCGLKGYDIYYRPTNAVIANPLLRGILEPRIGKDCEIIKLQPNYSGIYDIVCYYADMMAVFAEGAGLNVINSKLAYVLFAKNKQEAESLKKAVDEIQAGNPAVAINKTFKDEQTGQNSWDTFTQNLRNNYLAGNMLDGLRKLEVAFDRAVGIPIAADKKERLIDNEVETGKIESYTNAILWLEQLQLSCEKVNEMFGLNISVKMRDFGGGKNVGNPLDFGDI